MLSRLKRYWRTGRVYKPCAICKTGSFLLPPGTDLFYPVKVYHMKCIEKDMAANRAKEAKP